MSKLTEEEFLKSVATHEMTIDLNQGVHRCITFRKPNTNSMWFEIVTWPGHLAITGDMGNYVFTRLRDMFEFFRSARDGLHINKQYWEEKCVAPDRNGATRYSPEKFRQIVIETTDQKLADMELDEKDQIAIREQVNYEVLSRANDGQHEAMRAAMDFHNGPFHFSDFWEYGDALKEYTYQYVWCCYAIAWAIQKFDDVQSLKLAEGIGVKLPHLTNTNNPVDFSNDSTASRREACPPATGESAVPPHPSK